MQKKSILRGIETILHTELKFQFDFACFQRGEVSPNVDVSTFNNIVFASPTQAA